MKTNEFQTRQQLVDIIAASMPDEYPTGYAEWLADDKIKEGSVVILQP